MVSLRKLFSPGSGKFHAYFDEFAASLVTMSDVFIAAIYEVTPDIRKTQVAELDRLEAVNDTIAHKLFTELGRNFITPFDREDIYTLVGTLDDISDHMYAIIRQLRNYNIAVAPQPTKNVANNLQLMIKKLAEAIYKLRDKRSLESLYPLCQEIKRSAALCASLTDGAISRVYADEESPYEVIKKIDHYEMMHGILDRCCTASNVLESVIVKYA